MISPPPAVQIDQLTKRYPRKERWLGLLPPAEFAAAAVDRVSLSVSQGELFGLLGPNGAGKTTLIKMLATLVAPTSGSAVVAGSGLDNPGPVKAAIGLVTTDERSFYWRLTGRENLEFFGALHGLEIIGRQIDSALERVELVEASTEPFKNYSTGMRQRLAIARALLHNPRILFLDEPTRGLDPTAARRLHRLIREDLTEKQGLTVFLTTHWLAEAERLCDRVAVMHRGRIRGCGTLPELRSLIGETEQYQIQAVEVPASVRATLSTAEKPGKAENPAISITGDPDALNRALDKIRGSGGSILSVTLEQTPLETVFDRLTDDQEPAGDGETAGAGVVNPPKASQIRFTLFPSRNNRPSIPFLRTARAFLVRDWRSEASYRLAFLFQWLGILFTVGVFYFVAQLLGEAAAPYLEPYGGNYFAFVLIGIAFQRYFGVGLNGFARSLRRAQTTGTLEAMLTTPTRLSTIIISSSLWSYGVTTVEVLAFLLAGTGFVGAGLGAANLLAAVLILVLTILSFSSLGILAASFIMVLKRGDPITWVIGSLSALLGGVYYPITVLPDWLQWISNLLPITYALRAIRLALLSGASMSELLPDIGMLALFGVVLLPLSLAGFRYAVWRAQMDGSLTHY